MDPSVDEKDQPQAARRTSDSSAGDVDVPALPTQAAATEPSSKAERLSVLFTIVAAGLGLISDGCEWFTRFSLS
jgi:hypothetical protein